MIGRGIRAEWTAQPSIDPVQEPLTLDDAKLHASISQDDDNALLDAFIRAAREHAEGALGRGLFTQTRALKLSEFPESVALPFAAPLQSVTSVQYYDGDGVLQTLSTSVYTVETGSEPGCLVRAANQSWPSVQSDRALPVIVTYVCGWSDVAQIPEAIKLGMRLHIAASDGNRINPDYSAAEAVWARYGRVYWREPETCRG